MPQIHFVLLNRRHEPPRSECLEGSKGVPSPIRLLLDELTLRIPLVDIRDARFFFIRPSFSRSGRTLREAGPTEFIAGARRL